MKIGIQLYSVREPLATDFRGTLAKLAELGFEGVELAFFYGEMEPAELAVLMRELGLEVCGIYEGFDNLCDGDNKVYEYAKEVGCKYLTSGFNIQALKDDYQACVEKAAKACAVAAEKGLTLCYHAHAQEFEKAPDGKSYMDKLLEDVSLMAFEADTAWVKVGGENVVGYLEKQAAKIPLIHAKDVKADNQITELGNGVIDFAPVVEFARANNVGWISYEQDTTELTPLESAEISIKHLKSLL